MKTLLLISMMACFGAIAQLPDDALRYGFPLSSGTARNIAIGGAMASLGGDISAAHINPAGIGLYKSTELVLSPGFMMLKNKYNYLGSTEKEGKNGFVIGTTGIVVGGTSPKWRKSTSTAFALSINQLANYNNDIAYRGNNKTSSWSEQYVEELVRNNANIPAAENNYIFGSSLAYWTFLVDTLSGPSGNVIGYQSLVPISSNSASGMGVQQINQIHSRGSAHELAITYAENYNDKLYIGGSINFPFYSFNKQQNYREEDASNNTNNDFSFFEYQEKYSTKGFGFNGKIGLIYKPVNRIRLGLAFHTPTFGTFTDQISASITANTEKYTIYPQPATKSSNDLLAGSNAGNYEYNLITPYKLLGSFSFVINEVKDIIRQKGFITADVEYVNQGGVRYAAVNAESTDDTKYYEALNQQIKDRFNGVWNFRVGGELKFKTIMTRLGAAFLGSPYANSQLKSQRTLLSGGLGYRHHGIFIDLTYVHAMIKDVQIPYVLEAKAIPVADGKNNRGNVLVTFGIKI